MFSDIETESYVSAMMMREFIKKIEVDYDLIRFAVEMDNKCEFIQPLVDYHNRLFKAYMNSEDLINYTPSEIAPLYRYYICLFCRYYKAVMNTDMRDSHRKVWEEVLLTVRDQYSAIFDAFYDINAVLCKKFKQTAISLWSCYNIKGLDMFVC